METEIYKLRLHFKYCAVIASMVIIGVATERWSASKEFTTYLSNAATMTSLLLGVVAIFYSFVSNDSMSRSLGSIATITSEVRDVRDEIENFSEITKRTTESASTNNMLVQSASDNITTSLISLQQTLEHLSSQNSTLRELVTHLPSKIDQLDAKVGNFVKGTYEKPPQTQSPATPADLSDKAVIRFLERASLQQNLFSVACVLAFKTKKPLSVSEFTRAVEWDAPNQCVGYLSCMHSIQLCSRKTINSATKVFSITQIHPELIARSSKYFEDYINSSFEGDEEARGNWLKLLGNVQAIFENVEN